MLIRRLQILGLVIGPALFALSPFFWVNGHYGEAGGLLIATSTVPWVYGLVGEYERLRPLVPVRSGLWLLLVLVGMFGTIAFGLQGFFQSAIGDTDHSPTTAFFDLPLIGSAVFIASGPLFPTAVFLLGVLYWRTRLVPKWTSALLCIASTGFPIARATRLDFIAVWADLLMLLVFCIVAWYAWRQDLVYRAARRSNGTGH